MKHWEYMHVSASELISDEDLNKKGWDGWELISFFVCMLDEGWSEDIIYHYMFKREKVI